MHTTQKLMLLRQDKKQPRKESFCRLLNKEEGGYAYRCKPYVRYIRHGYIEYRRQALAFVEQNQARFELRPAGQGGQNYKAYDTFRGVGMVCRKRNYRIETIAGDRQYQYRRHNPVARFKMVVLFFFQYLVFFRTKKEQDKRGGYTAK